LSLHLLAELHWYEAHGIGRAYSTASQANLRYAFQLSPSTKTTLSAQPRELTNLPPNSNYLDLCYLTDDFKVHQRPI